MNQWLICEGKNMVYIENEGALFRGPSRSHPQEVYLGAGKGWAPYADAGKPKPIEWGDVIDEVETKRLMAEIDKRRGGEKSLATVWHEALLLAAEAHTGQIRKGTHNALGLAVPYLTHPVAVSALVIRYGGDEEQAIAALLHDVLEDGGPEWAGPIRERFGARVLALVEACTDGTPDASGQKAPWRERKEAYLAHLAETGADALLVSACDKLHNLQSILLDLTEIGEAVFDRFTANKDGTLWYYTRLVEAFTGRIPVVLETALRRELAELLRRAG